MDAKTLEVIQKLKSNPQLAQQMMQSPEGQKLMTLLTKDGGGSLERAAQSAEGGDLRALSALLKTLMQSPQGASLIRNLQNRAKQ